MGVIVDLVQEITESVSELAVIALECSSEDDEVERLETKATAKEFLAAGDFVLAEARTRAGAVVY